MFSTEIPFQARIQQQSTNIISRFPKRMSRSVFRQVLSMMVGGLQGDNLSTAMSLLAKESSLDTRKMAHGIVDCRAVISHMVSIAGLLWVAHSALHHAQSLRQSR